MSKSSAAPEQQGPTAAEELVALKAKLDAHGIDPENLELPPAPREPVKGERPKYRLVDKCYIDDILYEPQMEAIRLPIAMGGGIKEPEPVIIEYDSIPGAHMLPMNDAAMAMVAKHKVQYARQIGDAINKLTIITGDADVMKKE